MTSTLVADAMEAALSDLPPAADTSESTDPAESTTPDTPPAPRRSTTVGPGDGPLTAAQAEKLIGKAISSAATFADVMKQIIDRRAWEPLGYEDPRTMMRERFTGHLVNPRTGEPYDASYIRRMSNTAWVLWHLADSTGLDAADLHVASHSLAQIPSGFGGEQHDRLVDTVLDEVDKRGAHTAEEVQGAIDDTIRASVEAKTPTPPPTPEPPTPSPAHGEDDGAAPPEGSHEASAPAPSPRPEAGGDTQRYGESAGDEDDWQDEVQSSATDSFDADYAPGSQAPESSVSMADALDMMRNTEKTTSDVATLSGFPGELSKAVTQITQAVPGMLEAINAVLSAAHATTATADNDTVEGLFDSLDADELDGLHRQVEQAMEVIPAVKAAAAILGAVADQGDDLPGLGDISAAAQAASQAETALEKLNDYLDEIDFAAGGF